MNGCAQKGLGNLLPEDEEFPTEVKITECPASGHSEDGILFLSPSIKKDTVACVLKFEVAMDAFVHSTTLDLVVAIRMKRTGPSRFSA